MQRKHIIASVILAVAILLAACLIHAPQSQFNAYEKTNSSTQGPKQKWWPSLVAFSSRITTQQATDPKTAGDDSPYKVIVVSEPTDPWFHISVEVAVIVAVAGWITLLFVRQQVKALVNSERAWIEGNLVYHSRLDFDLFIMNYGKTAAHLRTFVIGVGWFNPKGKITLHHAQADTPDVLFGGGESHKVATLDLAKYFAREDVADKQAIAVQVVIKYRDIVTLGKWWRPKRQTTFVCIYNREDNSVTRQRGYTEYK